MTAIQALKNESEWSYSQLWNSLTEISEGLAWAQVELAPDAYLHSNGTIIGIVQHIAVCKFIYGSTAFRNTEVRWSTCFDRLDALGTSWESNKAYLDEAHRYWMSTWEHLTDADLDAEYLHFRGSLWPGWKIITVVNHHDGYHGGQINLLSSILTPVSVPPDLKLDEERQHVKDLPGW